MRAPRAVLLVAGLCALLTGLGAQTALAKVSTMRGAEALTALEAAIRQAPAVDPLLAGLEPLARQHPEAAVQIRAWREIMELQLARGKLDAAESAARALVLLDPQSWRARELSAALALYQGRSDQVRADLDAAFRLNPGEPFFSRLVQLSALWLAQGDRAADGLRMLDEQVLSREGAGPDALVCAVILARQAKAGEREQALRKQLESRYPASTANLALNDGSAVKVHPVFLVLGTSLGLGAFDPGPEPAPLAVDTAGAMVQLGLFGVRDNASRLADRIKARFPALNPEIREQKGKFRVLVGVPKGRSAEAFMLELKEAGFEGFLDR